ncbi:MAG TPA: gluconate 2-dehydrogenase subunit 3 family protein [Polyangia bacterium]
MDRRTFIRRGLVGGLLLSVGGSVGLAAWPSDQRLRARGPLRALDARQFAVLAAVAARTVTAPKADPITIAERVDAQMALAPPEVRADFGKLLLLFENALAGFVLDGRAKPFTRLSPAAQDEVLADWRDSRLVVRRSGFAVLRKLTQAAWYAAPEAWADVGYPGPPQLVVPQ